MQTGTTQMSTEASSGLTISDLATATGVSPATLRSWESRHGFPCPARLDGGHRRYRLVDVDVIRDIVRRRGAGQALPAAIAAAVERESRPEPSVFAALTRRHPGLSRRTVRKATALALTRAIEDECCARAEAPLLFVGFQDEVFYRQSRATWKELARTASAAVVFADFTRTPRGSSPLHVQIPDDSPLRREWFLVCDAPDQTACIVAWEIPGNIEDGTKHRRFELAWTVDPQVVRDAARICAGIVDHLLPGRVPAFTTLDEAAPAASADLVRAQRLLDRSLDYLDRRDDRS